MPKRGARCQSYKAARNVMDMLKQLTSRIWWLGRVSGVLGRGATFVRERDARGVVGFM